MIVNNRPESTFRLGLLLDSTRVSKYVLRFVNWARSQRHLDVLCFLIAPQSGNANERSRLCSVPNSTKQNRNGSLVENALFSFVVGLERLLLLKNNRHHDHFKEFDIADILQPEILRPSHDGTHYEMQSPVDLMIGFVRGASIAHMTRCARLGAICLTNSDDRHYRNGPAGFWEVYFREDFTGFVIQHFSGENEPRVILRGRVGTQFYYLLNQASLFEKSFHYLTQVVNTIAETRRIPTPEPRLPFCYRPTAVPTTHQTARYCIGLARLSALKLMNKVGALGPQLHVGFLHSHWRKAEFRLATIIRPPPRHFLADPFVISKGGKQFCFVEDYDELAQRGKITVYQLGRFDADLVGVALEESFHLSFPYLFYYRNDLYMCPETSESRDIRIYKCLEFPLRWQLEKIIMTDIRAVDSILFEKDEKWWLLTNTDPAQWGDFSLELRIFSANTPLDDKWIAHPLNPLFIDAARTRNGGFLREGDRLFRVAQGQGFDKYGKRTSVNEIIALNDQKYEERCICTIHPTFRREISGTHHLHADGDTTVIDFG